MTKPSDETASTVDEAPRASDAHVVLHHRVRYHEADAQGFLFNSRYLELADVAMTEFFRHLGFGYLELVASGADPSVVSAHLEFRAPARFEDVLTLPVRCLRVGTSSFTLQTEVWRGGAQLASISLTYVNVDAGTATSRPLPPKVAAALRADAADPSTARLEIHRRSQGSM